MILTIWEETMSKFDPLKASESIKESFVDYITTSFNIADSTYRDKLKQELLKGDYISKGPFLEVSSSFKSGLSLEQLAENGKVSKLFTVLEPTEEKKRELKIIRPLYAHQQAALEKANQGNNLVVTTGTGSGKTECFMIPILDALLKEVDNNTLDHGVRAIIIYPMNALANDQIKRMRKILKSYPQITFGLYNGNTEWNQRDALRGYLNANGGNEPLPNELISRERMQETPPHILITNYSMLEYMLLRPKDDSVFSRAKLKYIILDEAHVYRGTTGIETAMLIRRLKARINNRESVQFILTSATLGEEEKNKEIVAFAERLCGAHFYPENVIRSEEIIPSAQNKYSLDPAIYQKLLEDVTKIDSVLKENSIPISDDKLSSAEQLYDLLENSSLYGQFVLYTKKPIAFSDLFKAINKVQRITEEQLMAFIELCSIAEKEGHLLAKVKYHFFIRTLEGLYITIDDSKRVFLNRLEKVEENDAIRTVFEASVCSDCGKIALVGRDSNGRFVQVARKSELTPKECDYFLIDDNDFGESIVEEDEADRGENSYVVCASCGCIATRADATFGAICECEAPMLVPIKRAGRTESGRAKCPSCGFGSLRSFYLGYDAATAVLGTELFEQLPEEIEIRTEKEELTDRNALNTSSVSSLFSVNRVVRPKTEKRQRRFLCFSDSRSDAAYFASYMEKSYEEFLRRRAMVFVSSTNSQTKLSVSAFVEQLTRVFDNNRTFDKWSPDGRLDSDRLHIESESNAWVAVLNEMFNARRGTSLPSLGLLSFVYDPKDTEKKALIDALANNISKRYSLSVKESQALINLLVMDAVFLGAINNGNPIGLNDVEREYIFYSSKEKKLVLRKTSSTDNSNWVSGWAGRKKPNGKYYPNTRMIRLMRALDISEQDADEFLENFWTGVFRPEGDRFILNAQDFSVVFPEDEDYNLFQCEKCGRITTFNVRGQCSSIRCDGHLCRVASIPDDNHYVNMYNSSQMKPLQIKEHTAQLSKNRQSRYQKAFVDGDINALSCSTTFEMGVDVGGLETVYMRNVPPSPANYVQRAGRAGRSGQTAAFVLTFAKLSSHDLSFYKEPEKMISGEIKVPVFEIENEKVVNRHIYAVALSKFFATHEEVYAQDDQNVLLNEGGYEKLKEYLNSQPKDLKAILVKSIPAQLHEPFGINDYSWTDKLIGEDGVLEVAVNEFREEISQIEKAIKNAKKNGNESEALRLLQALKRFRCASNDGQRKKSLIEFLVRNNVLPKYGFPVDTVELQVNTSVAVDRGEALQLSRDLQYAIAEYAPGSEVIADGQRYVSRYIRKLPGKNNSNAWEEGFYAKCRICHEPNYSTNILTAREGRNCLSCGNKIVGFDWKKTLAPRRGFWTEGKPTPAPLRKPERDYKTDDYYVGDLQRKEIDKIRFEVNGSVVELESTANDTLAVVGQTQYKVCKVCGYATDGDFPKESHNDARGFKCSNRDHRNTGRYYLSHTFKTFVAKVTFYTVEANNYNVMLSVMYALLEGLSQELDIERNDIKGCLHLVQYKERNTNIYSIVLYDAVAGGAGHVRRLVTSDAKVFQRVLAKALKIVDECDCDPSCYQCLRNYYNSKMHDLLNRNLASAFLTQWLGEYHPLDNESSPDDDKGLVLSSGQQTVLDYLTWEDFAEAYVIDDVASWDQYVIPRDCLTFAEMRIDGRLYEPYFVWQNQKVAVFKSENEFSNLQETYGWQFFSLDVNPEDLSDRLTGD